MPPDFGWPSLELRNAAPGKESGAIRKDGNNNTASCIVPPRGDQDFQHRGAEVLDLGDARFRRDIEHLHSLGPRPVFELFAELAARHHLRTEFESAVARFSRLDPGTVAALGGDGWVT